MFSWKTFTFQIVLLASNIKSNIKLTKSHKIKKENYFFYPSLFFFPFHPLPPPKFGEVFFGGVGGFFCLFCHFFFPREHCFIKKSLGVPCIIRHQQFRLKEKLLNYQFPYHLLECLTMLVQERISEKGCSFKMHSSDTVFPPCSFSPK